ncbi:MAG: ribonucleotide reductase subunit alpha [Phenylobacterium sp.]|nr:ribonucleotide reductase subunit alpha [Phenylobacterium sp.]
MDDHFRQLLEVAASQPQPHRLLFVFAAAELPDEATEEQRARFQAGLGGALAPLMCVDKAPEELSGFAELAEESRQAGPPWQVVFAAALPGRDGRPPGKAEIDGALQAMIDAIRIGGVGRFAAYDAEGQPLQVA